MMLELMASYVKIIIFSNKFSSVYLTLVINLSSSCCYDDVTLLLFGVAQMFSGVYSSEEGPAVAELCDELGDTRPSMGKRCSCTQANLYFINKNE